MPTGTTSCFVLVDSSSASVPSGPLTPPGTASGDSLATDSPAVSAGAAVRPPSDFVHPIVKIMAKREAKQGGRRVIVVQRCGRDVGAAAKRLQCRRPRSEAVAPAHRADRLVVYEALVVRGRGEWAAVDVRASHDTLNDGGCFSR